MITKYGVFFSALLIAALFAAPMVGCNNTTTPPVSLNPGSLTADFPNGAEFNSTAAIVTDESSDYVIRAVQNIPGLPADEIDITIPKNTADPYTVTETNGADVLYYDNVTGSTYEANSAQGNCTITVNQISPTFEGSFSARVICNDTLIVLSNGAFNATYQ